MNRIWICLWVDKEAEEMSLFYKKIFENVSIGEYSFYPKTAEKVSGKKENSILTIDLKIENLNLQILNAGPVFKSNPSFSFMVFCSSKDEIKSKWNKLSSGGEIRMELASYPWASLYGWTVDKFGIEWQLIQAPSDQKIAPSFLFVNKLFGRGEEAIHFYNTVFPHAEIGMIGKDEKTGTVQYAEFYLEGQKFILMEGPGDHPHTFNNSSSLVINCEDQKEIDYYWDKLLEGGGMVEECGWLKDKFGLSWQVVPIELSKLMRSPLKDEVFSKLLTMTKIEIEGFAGLHKN